MKRRSAHLCFGALAALLATLAAQQAVALRQARHVEALLAGREAAADSPHLAAAQLLQALQLARKGDYEAALPAYKRLLRSEDPALRRAALYDLGNLNLREAMRRRAASPEEALPYLELAKQNYRDLLREDPSDWDARYNLERALWLAPESEQVAVEAAAPVHSERAITTMRGGRAALP